MGKGKLGGNVTTVSRGIYSIGALSRMLGISPTTLRSWEERYGVVVPERSAGSQRLYTRDHLEQLKFVCAKIEEGLSTADAHRSLAERLNEGAELAPVERGERRILLVERDPYAAELAEYFLRTEGYIVDVARTVGDAERIVSEHSVDLVVLDLMIGGGAGLQFCEQIGQETKVLAVSALDQDDRAMAAGAEGFIRKPFQSLTLLSTTRDLVGTSAIVRMQSRVTVE
jgi:DNA-binding transcriptional MerR regulator